MTRAKAKAAVETRPAVGPAIEAQANEAKEEASAALALVQEWPAITTQDQFTLACETLLDVKGQYKALEAKRKTITAPLWEAYQATQALFKPALDYLTSAERVLKQKVGEYTQAQERVRLAALAASTQAAPAIVPAPAEAPKGITVTEVRTWEVIDPDKVPREYCSPDQVKIQQAIDAGDTAIPGIRFAMTPKVIARTG
jgi:hypothetical protein